ncbi:hypothetical protein GCM10022233_15480 [Streptomyces shaanxiensis]|uniref:Uncharacterized protein n=1 Tax=Streptomyces shaanxiensis TaxID=653357 RepID=A0ABP7ULW2_9ACTN
MQVSSTRPRSGTPCSARNITGTVVMSSSSMIRGLVNATNALTRAPIGRRLGLWLVPIIPAGRDSTAVTHTPDRDIPASLPV